jgi:hypothetical protein
MLNTLQYTPGPVVIALGLLAILVIFAVWWFRPSCPREIHRNDDGTLRIAGRQFPNMNAFEQWWNSSGHQARCPLPLLTGARGADEAWPNEQTYAKTPINKVDDYEFSRIFGNERDGRMVVAKRDYNLILENRQHDWTNLPVSAESRRAVYAGLREGFSADGMLGSMDPAREAAARYGEHRGDDDIDCKISREAKEVAAMVAKAYENDPDYEPVVTKIGANHWEVNELKPRRRQVEFADPAVEERVVDTANDRVRTEFRYEQDRVNEAAIDPYFPASATDEGTLPWKSDRYSRDPWYGPVPGMERMMGPTFDRLDWTTSPNSFWP